MHRRTRPPRAHHGAHRVGGNSSCRTRPRTTGSLVWNVPSRATGAWVFRTVRDSSESSFPRWGPCLMTTRGSADDAGWALIWIKIAAGAHVRVWPRNALRSARFVQPARRFRTPGEQFLAASYGSRGVALIELRRRKTTKRTIGPRLAHRPRGSESPLRQSEGR